MSQKTVLLVEDDPDTRLIYRTILAATGFHVVEAADGREGVERAREVQPDLIVMNLVLPHIDGLSATELIRTNPATASTPIIACTAFVQEDGAGMAFDAGCNVYLEKPCEPTRLVAAVRQLLGDMDSAQPAIAGGA
jgi:two-component system, cell cycle response regulator DivK